VRLLLSRESRKLLDAFIKSLWGEELYVVAVKDGDKSHFYASYTAPSDMKCAIIKRLDRLGDYEMDADIAHGESTSLRVAAIVARDIKQNTAAWAVLGMARELLDTQYKDPHNPPSEPAFRRRVVFGGRFGPPPQALPDPDLGGF
jgi:hypothetical protein